MRLDEEVVELYRIARAAYELGDDVTAESFHRRIRSEHGCELYPAVELPEHLMFVHPIGCVLGRATYGDYLCAYQNSNVGSDLDGNRPKLGTGTVLFPGARVIGNVVMGDNVFVTPGTTICGTTAKPVTVPGHSVVYMRAFDGYDTGIGKNVSELRATWKHTKRNVIRDVFKVANV